MARAKKSLAFDVDSQPETSKANRLVLPLNSDNSIDWDSVRPSIREQFLNTVNNDVTTLEHIGMSHESAPAVGEDGEEGPALPLTEENVGAIIDSVSKTTALIFKQFAPMLVPHPIKSRQAGKRVGVTLDTDIALHCFKLNEKQHKELDPRGLRIAKKYIPTGKVKHLDAWLLAGMFLKYQADNAQNAIQMQVTRDLENMMKPQTSGAPSAKPVESDAKPKNPQWRDVTPQQPDHPAHPQPEVDESGIESLEPGFEPSV